MIIRTFNGKTPKIGKNNMIAENVMLIGDVEIGDNCSIWPGVVIRSDTTPIRIGNNVHIEENSILHTATHIEDDVMIGHGCCIEGFIGTGCMLGNTASMMPMSRMGAHSTLAAGSVIMDGAQLPEWSFILGVPAKVHSAIDPENPKHIARRAPTYINGTRGIAALAQEYIRQGLWAAEPTLVSQGLIRSTAEGVLDMAGPLDGMRVIDWTVWQQGPVAGAMLGDLGAEVIKIEEREGGDFGRAMYAINGMSTADQPNAYFEVNNRNKKSVAIDLRTPQGREIVQKLIAMADIFIHNFRPGVPEKFGLDYETLKALNPQLIYASASAFGANGPDGSARAYDTLGSARSGLSMAMAQPGTDVPISPPGSDGGQMGAIMLAYGVLAAVAARYRHGVGQHVETSLLGSMMWLQGLQFAMQLIMGFSLSGRERPKHVVNPLFTHYRCADGKWIAVADAAIGQVLDRLCRGHGSARIVGQRTVCRPLAAAAQRQRLFCDPGKSLCQPRSWHLAGATGGARRFSGVRGQLDEEAADDPQSEPNEYVITFDHPVRGPIKMPGFPVRLSETPASVRMRAPELGEHTEEVLISALGMTWDDFAPLRAQGVI